jgi:hypothetical protein
MGNNVACAARSAEIYAFLQEKLEGNTQVSLGVRRPDSFCFKISVPTKKAEHKAWNFELESHETKEVEFDGISISVPPDAMGNREGEAVCTFETALFLGNELVYVSTIDYEDVIRFYDMKSVLEEILRVANL